MAAPNPETQVAAPTAAPAEISEFENLLNKQFKPKTDTARAAVQAAVKTLAGQALASTQLISKDAVSTIEAIVAEATESSRADQSYHSSRDFKAPEGTWRGLHYRSTTRKPMRSSRFG
jgi:type VI secretion system protein ImpC